MGEYTGTVLLYSPRTSNTVFFTHEDGADLRKNRHSTLVFRAVSSVKVWIHKKTGIPHSFSVPSAL